MNNLFIIPILAAVMMIAIVPAAYAEITVTQENLTVEEQKVLDDIEAAKANGTYTQPPEAPLTATIQKYSEDVTIQAPFPVVDWYCGTVEWKLDTPEMTCVIVGSNTIYATWFVQDEEDVLAEKLEAQEADKQAIIDALTDDQIQFMAIQNKVAELKKIPNPSIYVKDYTGKLERGTFCIPRGEQDTEAFQTREPLEFPKEAIIMLEGQYTLDLPRLDDGKAYTFRGQSPEAKVGKFLEDCKAQLTAMEIVSPNHYRNMIMGADDFQPRHQDKAKLDKGIEAFGTDFTNKHDGTLENQAEIARTAYCLSTNFDNKQKKDYGCPSPYIGLHDPERGPSGFTLETAPPNLKHERWALTCGLIPDNGHIANDVYWDYLKSLADDYNCAHWDRIIPIGFFHDKTWNQEMIDEKIAEYLESQKQ